MNKLPIMTYVTQTSFKFNIRPNVPNAQVGNITWSHVKGRSREIFLPIHVTMQHFSGRIFMPLSFPVFFESEFLPLTLFFLWCLFRFSFKIVINLFCGRHFWCLCFVTEQKVTRQLMKKGRGRLTHPGQNPPRQVPSQRHVSEGFEFDQRLHIWICLDLVLKGQYNVLKSIEWRV